MPDESKANLNDKTFCIFCWQWYKKIQKQYILNILQTGELISRVNQPPLRVLKSYFSEKCSSDLNSSSKLNILSDLGLKSK